jgi:hypothetical protein
MLRLRPPLHAFLITENPLENAPHTSCYDHAILPRLLKTFHCQHADGTPWRLRIVELEGFLIHEGSVTAQPVTARYEFDEADDPMPVWLQPLLDQVQADLDRRERMA